MTVIAKVHAIGYIPNDKEHTVAYHKDVLRFVSGGAAASREIPDGHYKQSAAETEGEAFKLLQQQVVEAAARCKIDPKDLWISMVSVETEGGLYWPLHRQSTERKHRLSDLEIVSVWN
jgi:hypothetical protein